MEYLCHRNQDIGRLKKEKDEDLSEKTCARLWLYRDYESLLEKIEDKSIEKAALIYGEINLPTYGRDRQDLSFTYSSQFGLVQG